MKIELADVKVYVGEVGRAFVNVVHAQRELDAARKNVKDAEIIHQRADILIETCNIAIDDALRVQVNANKASTLLANTINSIQQAIDSLQISIDTTTIPEVKAEYKLKLKELKLKLQSLKTLRNDVNTNDFDFNLFNGGSDFSADENIKLLTNPDQHTNEFTGGALEIAQDVSAAALRLKADNEAYVLVCEDALKDAEAEFESWLTDDEDATQNDISDALELKYNKLLDKVEQILREAEEINEAIDGTSEYIHQKIEDIMEGIEYKSYAKFKLSEDKRNQLIDMLSEFSAENGEEIKDFIADNLFYDSTADTAPEEEKIGVDPNVYSWAFIQYPTGIKSIGLRWTFETKIPEGNTVTATRTILDILHPYGDGIFVQGLADDANLRLSVDAIALIKSVLYSLDATQDIENPEYYSILEQKPQENSEDVLASMVVTLDGSDQQYSVLDAIDNIAEGNVDGNEAVVVKWVNDNMIVPDTFEVAAHENNGQYSTALFIKRRIITPSGETLTDKSSLVEVFSTYKNGIFVLPYSGNANVEVNGDVKLVIDNFLATLHALSTPLKGIYQIRSYRKQDETDPDIDINPGSTILPSNG